MKNRSVSLCLLTATLFASLVFARAEPTEAPPVPPVPGHGPQPGREAMIKRFDQDGDGQLNEAERGAAREAMKKHWAEMGGPMMREKMLRHFDRDGDGRLNPNERRAAWKKMSREHHHRKHHHHHRRGHRHHGSHGRVMEGKMARQEGWMGARRGPGGPMDFRGPAAPGAMRHEMIKRFDQDQDGQLNEAERAEAKKAGEAMRTRRQEQHKEMLARFDADGNGRMDPAESKSLQEAWQKFIQAQPLAKPAQ